MDLPYATDRGPLDVNLHKNNYVCDVCHERYPQLKGKFSQQRPTGHVETLEVTPTNTAPNALPTVVAKPLQLDNPPKTAKGLANIAPLDAIAAYKRSDYSACLHGVRLDSHMQGRALITHKCVMI